MIVFDEMFIYSEEMVEELVEVLKKNAYKEDLVEASNIFHDFLIECLDADRRLQEMTSEKLGDKYISFVILPVEDVDDLLAFSFQLAHEDDIKIKRREEIRYRDLCDICFGGIKPYYLRLLEFYDDLEKNRP